MAPRRIGRGVLPTTGRLEREMIRQESGHPSTAQVGHSRANYAAFAGEKGAVDVTAALGQARCKQIALSWS